MSHRNHALLAIFCLPLLAWAACEVTVVVPPEYVLAGQWVLTGDEVDTFIDKTLHFDSEGRLIRVDTRVNNSGTIQTIVQDNFERDTDVSGDFVRIEIPGSFATGFVDDIVFEGNLNPDQTEAEGELQTEAEVFGDTVITPQGPGRIVKQ